MIQLFAPSQMVPSDVIIQFRHIIEKFQVVLFNTNNSIQHYSFILHTVKWFQVLLCITNYSTKHQSFVYTRLHDQTVLFQTSQFNTSHFFHTV